MDKAIAYLKQAEDEVNAFFKTYDAWLTPVLAATPPKIGDQGPNVPFSTLYERVTQYVAYTPIHNIAGTPAMSIPLSQSSDGLPIGSQL